MGNSVNTSDSTADAAAMEHHRGLARALLSAAIFGSMGAFVGNWLGKRANASAEMGMAQPMMKWGMGLFSATLAAYSSFKATEHAAKQTEQMAAAPTNETITASLDKKIDAATVSHLGKLEQQQALQRG
jgi:hypothetical protein